VGEGGGLKCILDVRLRGIDAQIRIGIKRG